MTTSDPPQHVIEANISYEDWLLIQREWMPLIAEALPFVTTLEAISPDRPKWMTP